MRQITRFVLLSAALLTPALAQTAPGAGNGPTPAQQAQFKKYQPVFDLTRTVGLMAELDANKPTALSKAQAGQLLPMLKELGTRADLKPADATKILNTIEDSVLTDAQVTKLDDLTLKRQEEARARRAQNGGGQAGAGLRFGIPGVPGGAGAGQGQRPGGPGGPGGRGGLFAAIQSGQPFNPFKAGRSADALKALVAALQKK